MRALSAMATCLALAAFLSGCASPKIDRAGFARPQTVAIVDFLDAKPAATIGMINANLPYTYFTEAADPYFAAPYGYSGNVVSRGYMNSVTTGAAAGGLLGAVIGAAIDGGAEATQRKAQGYPAEVAKVMPGVDIRTDVLTALRTSLEAKGILVAILDDSRNLPPRLRWPTTADGKETDAGALADSPPVEADVVVQVVPLVLYVSPGPLNNYNSVVGIGLAMYEGRTRKFLGWQAFQSNQNKLWYARYDSLVADLAQAAPAQHAALMSLIPQVADTISGEPAAK